PSATRHFIQQFCRETGIFLEFLLDEQVWEQAANAFVAYVQRRRQSRAGSPKRLLVDFIVAAHALHRADRLMTLDANRYRQDFPKLRLLCGVGSGCQYVPLRRGLFTVRSLLLTAAAAIPPVWF